MNRYESTTHRAAFGIAAIAMSALTLGLTVVLPANLAGDRHEAQVLAVATRVAPAPREVAIIPARIDVSANCDQKMPVEQARNTSANRDQSS